MKIPGKRTEFFAPARHKVLRDRIRAYLATMKPADIFNRPAADLDPMIDASIALGEDLGLKKVSGHKRLAYLYVLSEGQLARTPEALDFIRYGGTDPDSQTSALIRQTAQAIKEDGVFPSGSA